MAKWVVEIDRTDRIPELVSRAFHVATQGRPGPVVIALPEDMLIELAEVEDAPAFVPAMAYPSPHDMDVLQRRLDQAKAPILLLGGSGWDVESVASLGHIARRWQLPVAVSFRRQMLFPSDHPNFAGDLGIGPNPRLLNRIQKADLIILLGGRLSEMPSQSYTLLKIPGDGERLVHIHPGAEELNRVYRASLAIPASPESFVKALATLAPPVEPAWAGAAEIAHGEFLAWSDPTPIRIDGDLQMGQVMKHLIDTLPADSIMCNGAGNYASWLHRFWPFRHFGTQLAPTSGSMGYGLPAAVGAKRTNPERMVVAFAGDGCFLMNGQEFATAIQYELPIIVLVIDNGMYGTIRMHQERDYPNRISATELKNPDFAALARAYGGHGETVRTTDEFSGALDRALRSGKPAILHLFLSQEAITPTRSLSDIRKAALAKPK